METYITSVLVFNLCLVLFVQVNENDVLLLCSDARKSFTRDLKNVFGTVPISCGFTFPVFSLTHAQASSWALYGSVEQEARVLNFLHQGKEYLLSIYVCKAVQGPGREEK